MVVFGRTWTLDPFGRLSFTRNGAEDCAGSAASAGAITRHSAVYSLGKGRDARAGHKPALAAILAREAQAVRARHDFEEVDSQTGNRLDLRQP